MEGAVDIKSKPATLANAHNVIAFVLICGFNIRFFDKVLLEHGTMLLDLCLYAVLLFCIDYSRNVRYLPYLVVMSLLILMNTEATRLVFIILLCFFYLKVDIRTLARYNLMVGIVVLLAVWWCVEVGVLENEKFEYSTSLGLRRVRQSLGMGLNRASLYVSSLVACLYVLIANRNKYLVAAVVFAISYITYEMSGSQSCFVGGIMLCLIILACGTRLRRLVTNKTLLLALPLVLTFGLVFMAVHMDTFLILDAVLSGRIHYSAKLLDSVSFMNLLIGTPGIEDNAIVDNIYLRLLYEGGIVFYIFFYTLYYKTVKSLSPENEYLVPVVLYFLIIGFMEANFLSVAIIGNSLIWAIIYQGAHRYDALKQAKI